MYYELLTAAVIVLFAMGVTIVRQGRKLLRLQQTLEQLSRRLAKLEHKPGDATQAMMPPPAHAAQALPEAQASPAQPTESHSQEDRAQAAPVFPTAAKAEVDAPSDDATLQALEALRARRTAQAGPSAAHRKRVESSRPSPGRSMEEKLGVGLFIWVGGVALVLAVGFLVKYSFDNNLISPLVRVMMGSVFGAGLIVTAQFMFRRSAKIAGALAGAGVAGLFACLLAASSLYELIGPWPAFVLMVLLTAMSIVLALRHGSMMAILGLLGGYATPALIGTTQHQHLLLGYLVLLQAGVMVVAGRRGWMIVSGLTLVGAVAWMCSLLFTGMLGHQRFVFEAFIILTAVIYVMTTAALGKDKAHATADQPQPAGLTMVQLSAVASFVAICMLGMAAWDNGFATMDLAMCCVLSAGIMLLGRVRPVYRHLSVVSLVASFVLMVAFAIRADGRAETDRLILFTGIYGLLFGIGGFIALWRSGHEIFWATISLVGAAAMAVLLRFKLREPVIGWEWIELGIIAVWSLMAAAVWRWRRMTWQHEHVIGIYVTGATACAIVAAVEAWTFPWTMAAWAGLAVVNAVLVKWQRICGAKHLAVALACFVTLLLILPGPRSIPGHHDLILNQLLVTYGLCAVLLGLAAWLLHRGRAKEHGQLIETMAIVLAALAVLLQVRLGFGEATIWDAPISAWEWASLSIACLIMAHGLAWWYRSRPQWPQASTSAVLACAGVMMVILGAGFIDGPWWDGTPVGAWPVLNGLLFLYGLPALLIGLFIINLPPQLSSQQRRDVQAAVGTITLILAFALVTLQVRQFFAGTNLSEGAVTNAEMYSYSAAWIIMAILLVAMGIRRDSKALRYASLAVMVAAIGKVFLLDTAHLKDLYRVLSLLGLGVTLLGVGYFYQRFVFRKKPVSYRTDDQADDQADEPPRTSP